MTREEWEWIRERLIEGCTFLYEGKYKATILEGGSPYAQNDRIRARFEDASFDQNWSEYGMDKWFFNLSALTWPDGTEMIPFEEQGNTLPMSPIIRRVLLLEKRFKDKSLTKTKMERLSLP